MESGLSLRAAAWALFALGLLAYGEGSRTPVHTRRMKTHRCEKLTIPMCVNMNSHDTVSLPNLMGHLTQEQVRKAFQGFKALMKDGNCSSLLRPFLCLALAPACAQGHRRPPCKGSCLRVRARCAPAMKRTGISWPKALDCKQLPKCGKTKELNIQVSSTLKETVLLGAPKTKDVPQNQTSVKQAKGEYKTDIGKLSKDRKTSNATIYRKGKVNIPAGEITSSVKKPNQKKVKSNFTEDKKRSAWTAGKELRPRRYDIMEMGDPSLYQGWADVQGQGAANDYCRIVGKSLRQRFLACALGGSTEHFHTYVSIRGIDVGHRATWFMRDMDNDGRDDYCRCVGQGIHSKLSCMKAGPLGFEGSSLHPGSQYSFTVYTGGPCINRQVNSVLGMYP